jgi:hypothetical protein
MFTIFNFTKLERQPLALQIATINISKLLFIWMLFSTALDANNPDTDRRSKEHGVA